MARQSSDLRERRKTRHRKLSAWSPTASTCSRACSSMTPNSRGSASSVNERLHNGSTAKPGERPDFVFYTGCNVLKTPHMALTALDIMDALGVTYKVMGGPTHCCGVIQLRTGDTEVSGRVAREFARQAGGRKDRGDLLVRELPRAVHRNTLPTIEKVSGARPFEMTPFMLFLADALRRLAADADASRCRCGLRCTSIRASRAWWKPAPPVAHGAGH